MFRVAVDSGEPSVIDGAADIDADRRESRPLPARDGAHRPLALVEGHPFPSLKTPGPGPSRAVAGRGPAAIMPTFRGRVKRNRGVKRPRPGSPPAAHRRLSARG